MVSHTGLLPSMVFFPADSATTPFVNSWAGTHTDHKLPYNPTRATNAFLALAWFGLFPVRSPLLGESRLISLPPGTEMFQFPGFATTYLCIQYELTRIAPGRVSPFGHPWIKACLAAPHGFSQPSTSFIASRRQGIHQ